MEGYRERREQDYQTSWEQLRWQTALLLSPNSKQGVKPTDLLKFPWEKEEPVKAPDIAVVKKIMASYPTPNKK